MEYNFLYILICINTLDNWSAENLSGDFRSFFILTKNIIYILDTGLIIFVQCQLCIDIDTKKMILTSLFEKATVEKKLKDPNGGSKPFYRWCFPDISLMCHLFFILKIIYSYNWPMEHANQNLVSMSRLVSNNLSSVHL